MTKLLPPVPAYLLFVVILPGLQPLLLLLFSSVLRSTFLSVLLPVRTSVTHSVTATSRPLFTRAPSWPVSGGESAPGGVVGGGAAALVFLLACAIGGDACQGLCQQISTDADGR